MRPSFLRVATGLLLGVTILTAGAVASAPAAADFLSRIDIRGNSRTSSQDIVSLLGVRLGDAWSPQRVSEGVRRLYARGLFRDVAVRASRAPEGIELWVEVEEKPVIAGVELVGTKKVDKKDLQEVLTLGAGSLYDEATAQEDLEAIRAKMREKGYHRARVEPVTETMPDGKVFVRFRIDEGVKTRVHAVRFQGNEHVPADALTEKMKTRPRKWFTGGGYDEKAFEEDLGRVTDQFRARGYLDAQVTDEKFSYDDQGGLTILLTVEEGRQYRVGTIAFAGNQEVSTAELAGRVKLVPGDIFSEEIFQQSLEGLYDAYGERGHIYATIDPQRSHRDDLVDVSFLVEEGEPAHVGRIEIAGNEGTKEKVIRRELQLVPGDLFRRSALIRSHREVYSLGFFEDVQVKTDVSPKGPDIDLTFEVKEKETGQFLAGASYSGEFGMIGSVELAKPNFRGTGETVSLKWEFGRLGQLEFSFTEPWFRGTPTSVGVDLFNTRLRRDTYTERSQGGALRVGRPLPWLDYTRAFVRYKWEAWEVSGEGTQVAVSPFSLGGLMTHAVRYAGEGNASSIQVTLARNSTDSPFFPTRGSTARVTSEFSGGILGGDTGFQVHEIDQQLFFPAWRNLVLSFGARGGVISRYRGGNVPIFERFRLGGVGPNGVRGYPDQDVVPRGNDPAEGGLAMLILRSELRFPITGPQLSGLFFLDAGNTWNSLAEARPEALMRGAGIGFRVEIPGMGTLGFDYGYGFDRPPELGGPGWELHFNIGSAAFY